MSENEKQTLKGEGSDASTCYAALIEKALRIYEIAHSREWNEREAAWRYHNEQRTNQAVKIIANYIA